MERKTTQNDIKNRQNISMNDFSERTMEYFIENIMKRQAHPLQYRENSFFLSTDKVHLCNGDRNHEGPGCRIAAQEEQGQSSDKDG